MLLTLPPPAPSRANPSTFPTRMDEFLAWLVALIPELNAFLAEVQPTLDDATAGNLLRVGGFGLGAAAGIAAPGNDADQCLVGGIGYRFPTTGINCPQANPYGGVLVVHPANVADELTQVFYARQGGRMWSRGKRPDTGWSNWREYFHQGSLLGTVSQSAGVPTGALIERGSNANGDYVRFADGMQICTSATITADLTTAAGSVPSLFMTPDFAATFPAAFAATPVAFGMPTNTNTAWCNGRCSSTQWTGRGFGYTSATARTFVCLAHGRWF